MRTSLLMGAVGVLVVSNAFVLTHVALNRSGSPDSEMELTGRELRFGGSSGEDSSVTLTLTFQNPSGAGGWFDRNKMAELGFDTSVPAESKEASRFYVNARSREVFVALEYDGPAWQRWLKERESQAEKDLQYGQQVSVAQRIEIERQTASRLVIVDAALDPATLRTKYPDRKQVMILRGLARVMLTYPAALRGEITSISTASINVPAALRGLFDSQSYYSPYTYDGQQIRVNPPPYAVALRVGPRYEPWVADVTALR